MVGKFQSFLQQDLQLDDHKEQNLMSFEEKVEN